MAFVREAYVTLCTNENYVSGAQVLAHSLKQSGTTRDLVCMTSTSLPQYSREILRNSYDTLIDVDLIDTLDKDALALLGRPELGITATKITCWTLVQYSKCVFLDADTLVKTNVDELFQRPELAAAPDIGWPDCFNSGVFVYKPSMSTFSALVNCLKTKGSFDGGDQGLLNEYFSSWSTQGPEHRLPFTYNMTANAAYGYAPAYERFRDDVKIIHFIGATKPWHSKPSTTTQKPSNQVEALTQEWHAVNRDFNASQPHTQPMYYSTPYTPLPSDHDTFNYEPQSSNSNSNSDHSSDHSSNDNNDNNNNSDTSSNNNSGGDSMMAAAGPGPSPTESYSFDIIANLIGSKMEKDK